MSKKFSSFLKKFEDRSSNDPKYILSNVKELENIFKRAFKVKHYYNKKGLKSQEHKTDKAIEKAFKCLIESGDYLESIITEVEKKYGFNPYKS